MTGYKSLISRSLAMFAGAFFLAFCAQGSVAMAQVTACDPQFMDAIDARGFAEAARENVMNETFILKSDSVFEYSCFRLHADLTTEQRASTLSFEEGLAATATFTPVDGYLFNNFNHRYLSGRYQDPNPALPDPVPGYV